MLARIRKAQENEEGFTLIELLVVMIIIGILAAIAIPTFLNQRNNGYNAATKSDLKNAATALESAAVDLGGDYTLVASIGDVAGTDFAASGAFVASDDVTITSGATTATGYCLSGVHTATGEIFTYSKATGIVADSTAQPCPIA